MCKENAILPSSDWRLYCNLNSFPTEEHEKIIKQHCCTTTNCDLTRFFAAVHIGNTGIPRLVRFFGPQQTALLEKPH